MLEKRLYSLKEFVVYTGFSMTKAREIAKRHECEFTVRTDGKIYIDIIKFNEYMEKCMRYGIAIQ